MSHHELKQLEGGKIEVKLETGEVFTGDPLEVTAKLADSKVETRRHYEQKEADLLSRQPEPVVQPVVEPNNQEAQWQAYILDQTAKGLGYKNADEYKAVLGKVLTATSEFSRDRATLNFQSKYPDYPNTDEAGDALVARAQKDFGVDLDSLSVANPQQASAVMAAAHLSCLRDGVYKPLSAEEQNASWSDALRQSNRPHAAPMLPSSAPDSAPTSGNEWQMPLDQLRKQVLTAGK